MAIYLDNNATTPLAPEVISAIRQACEEAWANPSSGYKRGREAKSILEAARIHMAALVDQEPDVAGDVITFTSGGTEVRYVNVDNVYSYVSINCTYSIKRPVCLCFKMYLLNIPYNPILSYVSIKRPVSIKVPV